MIILTNERVDKYVGPASHAAGSPQGGYPSHQHGCHPHICQHAHKQPGFSSIIVLLTLLLMAGMGGAIAYMVSVNQTGRGGHFQSLNALYEVQAGIEYSVKQIYNGLDGVVADPITLGLGNFTVARNGNVMTVTGIVGDATRVYRFDSPSQADCEIIDASGANTHNAGTRISAITFRKNCLPTLNIIAMVISWVPDNGEKLNTIRIEEDTIYDNAAGILSGAEANTDDYLVDNPNNNVISRIVFDSDMTGKTMTVQFNMDDASTKTVTFVVPDE